MLIVDRCKQAECERQKEEIQNLKMEIAVLQRRGSATGSILSISRSLDPIIGPGPTVSGVASNVATFGTGTSTTVEKNIATTVDNVTEEKSESPNLEGGAKQDP